MIRPHTDRKELTDMQAKILKALVEFVREHKYQPSMSNLAEIVGISTANVHAKFQSIALAGWVTLTGAPRSIIIAEDVMEEM